jgi:endonuclease YncB( thermonuclease family)
MSRIIALLIFLMPIPDAFADISGKPKIIDGDTIEISGERIRLHGIDAPESRQKCIDYKGEQWWCGEASTNALVKLAGDLSVNCKGNKQDRYKRLIAVCYLGNVNLNAKMVEDGWALAYRKYSTAYVSVEADAKAKNLGLWQSQFLAPWDWRRGKRLASKGTKACCKICRKGKACGNSCIRKTYTCREEQGCACDSKR